MDEVDELSRKDECLLDKLGMRTFTWRRILAVGIVAASAAGCKSGSPGSSGGGSLQQAVNDFNARRYARAQERAEAIASKSKPGVREDAAYVAGLSAYELGQTEEAERHFVSAARSANAQTAARAKAMLGQVRLDQNRPQEAANLLAEAARAMDGADSERAARNAAIAYQRAGDEASAKKWASAAGAGTPARHSPGSTAGMPASGKSIRRGSAGSNADSGGFTLQVGAFREKSRAERAANEAKKLAERDGLGEVQIVPRRDERGKLMFVVQFGSFGTRAAAAAARAKLGRLDYIVALAQG